MKKPRVVLQSESTECGLACIAMVAEFHGLSLNMRELRGRFPQSAKGLTLPRLIEIAGGLGLRGRALRLDLSQLGRLALPCILHWDLNHFVVLSRVKRDSATIIDPACGERTIDLQTLSSHFTGVALELQPSVEFKPAPPKPAITLHQLTGPIKGLARSLGVLLALSLVLQLFVGLAPFYVQWVIDQVLVAADRSLLVVLAIGFALALLVQVGIGLVRGWSVVYLSTQLGLQWIGNIHVHLLRLPMAFFEKRHVGDVMSRMGAAQAIQRTLTTSAVEAVVDGLMAIVTLAMMVIYSAKLAAVTVGAVGLYLGLRLMVYRYTRERTEQQLIAAAKQQSHLLESLRGIQSLKVANRESLRGATYENLMVDTVNHELWLARAGVSFNGANQLVFGAERIVVVLLGAVLTLDATFSVGMLVAYLAYREMFSQRIGALIDKAIEFRMLRLFGERLADVVLTAPEVATQLEKVEITHTGIEVENLSFRYADGEDWVVRDCSFSIESGESAAIIGASGCGKTTLVKLLLGLLTPTSGVIRIGGRDIQQVGARNIRSMVGAVMQDDQLFAGSIADNISFFDPAADRTSIEAAAELAGVHADIQSLPMGYHSLIGDMGSSLSGGQKQRIVLARALFRRPRLLLLDEATSHLDVERERLVNDAVRSLAVTKVIVAHRPDTVASADKVLHMESGGITDRTGKSFPFASRPQNLNGEM